VETPEAGAIVVFSGVTRNNSNGKKVLYLEYEAYTEMAVKMMERIGLEAKQKWNINKIAITHRIGRLEIGESSVVIAVSAPHRKEAFEACHFAIDRLKQIVTIWKKEYFEDGAVWV
jgi:molybdopterin synthase catalytic subunit